MSPCLFQYFTDGTTNKLVGCYLEDSPEDVVLVRVYGNKTELIVDRENELKSFQVETRLTQALHDGLPWIRLHIRCASVSCRFSMPTAALLVSTAPSRMESAMSSFTGTLWGHRMSGILQYSGGMETCYYPCFLFLLDFAAYTKKYLM